MHPGCTAVGGPGSRCGKRCTTSERSRTNCSIVCGKRCPGIVLVGHPAERLPNTLNVLFPRVSGRKLLEACPQVLASTGSACHADREEASLILRVLGIPEGEALGAVRLSLGATTTPQDVEESAAALGAAWRRIAE